MASSESSFETQIIQDLENLLTKIIQELKQQKELLDPKVMALMRLYLSTLRQYLSCVNNLNRMQNNPPAGHVPSQSAHSILPSTDHSRSASLTPCSAPGLLMHPQESAPAHIGHIEPLPARTQPLRVPMKTSLAGSAHSALKKVAT
ncbi:MAG: hypothetical protein ACE15F_16530 [bacterium]